MCYASIKITQFWEHSAQFWEGGGLKRGGAYPKIVAFEGGEGGGVKRAFTVLNSVFVISQNTSKKSENLINPFTPESDQLQFSLIIISPER